MDWYKDWFENSWLDKLLFNRLAETRPGTPGWRWTPKLGEFYYHYDFERGRLYCTMCDPGPEAFQIRVATGNCFKHPKDMTVGSLEKILKNLTQYHKLNGFAGLKK